MSKSVLNISHNAFPSWATLTYTGACRHVARGLYSCFTSVIFHENKQSGPPVPSRSVRQHVAGWYNSLLQLDYNDGRQPSFPRFQHRIGLSTQKSTHTAYPAPATHKGIIDSVADCPASTSAIARTSFPGHGNGNFQRSEYRYFMIVSRRSVCWEPANVAAQRCYLRTSWQ